MSVTRDGKQLEALVAFVEKALLPEGFEVRANERVYNDEGAQIAELDVEIRGRIGSTNISWLIECRDRPGDGPAPGAWIEQLVGRRTRFGFNKAVSYTHLRRAVRSCATSPFRRAWRPNHGCSRRGTFSSPQRHGIPGQAKACPTWGVL